VPKCGGEKVAMGSGKKGLLYMGRKESDNQRTRWSVTTKENGKIGCGGRVELEHKLQGKNVPMPLHGLEARKETVRNTFLRAWVGYYD